MHNFEHKGGTDLLCFEYPAQSLLKTMTVDNICSKQWQSLVDECLVQGMFLYSKLFVAAEFGISSSALSRQKFLQTHRDSFCRRGLLISNCAVDPHSTAGPDGSGSGFYSGSGPSNIHSIVHSYLTMYNIFWKKVQRKIEIDYDSWMCAWLYECACLCTPGCVLFIKGDVLCVCYLSIMTCMYVSECIHASVCACVCFIQGIERRKNVFP